MKKGQYSTEQIIGVLKAHEAGVKIPDLIRKHGFSEQSLYRWKSKYGGLEVSDAKLLKELEQENARLKNAAGGGGARQSDAEGRSGKNVWSAPCSQQTSTSSARRGCNNVSGLFSGSALILALMELRSGASS